MTRPMPPSGANPPPEMRTSSGAVIELLPIAHEICRRYHDEFADEYERYGPEGQAWCLHDNQYLLAWAIQDVRDGTVDLIEQALWLADVLASRDFPVERLVRDLEIAADVAGKTIVADHLGRGVSVRLTAAAIAVRATLTEPGST
ncbi:hypothetical protein [Gaiella sp.]|uniref:hypothetical protein n=1 Tax=Gaiella sp. TaxID=2663207 RepID=UPI0032641A87